jgi:Protein of unknown function (DUF2924)
MTVPRSGDRQVTRLAESERMPSEADALNPRWSHPGAILASVAPRTLFRCVGDMIAAPDGRIQELAYGGLKPETIERLEALGEQLDGGNIVLRRTRAEEKPISGTRLIREWRGVEHCVTVRDNDYE